MRKAFMDISIIDYCFMPEFCSCGYSNLHVTATMTDTSNTPSSLEKEITIERSPLNDIILKEDYDRSQCVYGPDSSMPCIICSQQKCYKKPIESSKIQITNQLDIFS